MRRLALISCLLVCAAASWHSAVPVEAQESVPVVRVPFPRDDGTLTPYSFQLGYPFVTLIYDTLLWRDLGGEPRPWLARSVKRSPGGRRLVLRLRRGARWHDGRPLTSADVAFTFDFVATHPHLRFTPQLRAIRRVRAVDPYTVTIDLRHPAPGFLDQPLSDVPILPRHLWAGRPPDQPVPPGLPVGSGPYRLTSYRPGEGYRFAANRGYFRGRPRVARIEVDLKLGGRSSLDALERGRVDIIPTGLPTNPGDADVEVRPGVNYTGTTLALNLRAAPFDRPSARRAVARALDVDRIAESVGHLPARGRFLHPDSPWEPGSAPPSAGGPPFRRELARMKIEVLAARDDPVRAQLGRQVVGALRRAGARARLTRLPRRAFESGLGAGGSSPRFQAAVTGIAPLVSYDPDYLRTTFATGAPLNQAGYRSVAFDRLAERVARTPDRGARLEAVAAELRRLARDVPSIPLAFSQGAFAYRPSAYDGWVSVTGTGALDKRSFLAPEAAELAQRLPKETASGDAGDGFPFGALGFGSLGLLLVAIALSAAGMRRRRDGR